MKTVVSFCLFFSVIFSVNAQSEQEIMSFLAKICVNDSIDKTLAVPSTEEDSLKLFHFAPINMEEYGLAVYDYEGFRVIQETSSNLLFAKVPYGKITIVNYTGKSCSMIVEISGAGDRSKMNLWQYGSFTFQIAKGGRWLLSDVYYSLETYTGNPSNSGKKSKK